MPSSGPNGETNEAALDVFKRLLRNLQLDEQIAYKVADSIDHDSEPKSEESEQGQKMPIWTAQMSFPLSGELIEEVYEKLCPLSRSMGWMKFTLLW